MASERFEVVAVIPASPEVLYRAWLDGKEHARMTGGPATGAPEVGAEHSAWDGYIVGRNLELEPGVRIVQSWRTSEFPEGAPDSRLEVLLEEDNGGTRLVLRHSEIPEGQGASYEEGWVEHYIEPMQAYFAKAAPARKPVKPKPAKAKKKAARKAAPKKKKATASSRSRKAGAARAAGGGRKKPSRRPRRR